jgi:hypothetical protein
MPDVLRELCEGCLVSGWSGGLEEARVLAEQQARLFPNRLASLESQAELALRTGQWADALRHADQGLKVRQADPRVKVWRHGLSLSLRHDHLKVVRIEALGAMGCAADAEAAAATLSKSTGRDEPWLACVRGAHRGGNAPAALAALLKWLDWQDQKERANAKVDGWPSGAVFHVMRSLRKDPYLGPHFDTLASQVPSLQAFAQGPEAECAAIVRSLLPADDPKAHFGDLPPQKKDNVQASIVGDHGGKLLYFYDWSFWQNGKTGLALTTTHVIWRCAWSEPIVIPLKGLKRSDVNPLDDNLDTDELEDEEDETILRVGQHRVDLGKPGLAWLLHDVIKELIEVVNR